MPRTHEKMLNITNYQRNGNQTTVLTTVRMVIIKKPTKKKCWRQCGEKETFLYCWRVYTDTSIIENSMEVP